MTDRRLKWWLIPIVILIAAIIALALFWDALAVYLAPKTVLTAALTNTWAALEERFSGSPLPILGKVLDESGRNTILMELETTDELLGDVRYNMTVQTELSPKRIYAQGTAATGSNTLDISFYLDNHFAAVSSDGLLKGNFYGITYDTFSQDIRSNTLLTFMLGEETIREWETSVASLQEMMDDSIVVPEITEEDIRMAMVGIMALKADVGKETVELGRGAQECYRIRFQASLSQIVEGFNLVQIELPFEVDADSVMTASIYLAEETVVKCVLDVTGVKEELSLILVPDLDPQKDSIHVSYTHQKPDLAESFDVTVSTGNGTGYTEEISVRDIVNGQQKKSVIRYDWDQASGNMQMECVRNESRNALTFNLTETENGFRLETGDFEALMAILTGGEDKADSLCVLTVSQGADFAVPSYKNFDLWSMEDMLVLLGSIGSLFGLKIS